MGIARVLPTLPPREVFPRRPSPDRHIPRFSTDPRWRLCAHHRARWRGTAAWTRGHYSVRWTARRYGAGKQGKHAAAPGWMTTHCSGGSNWWAARNSVPIPPAPSAQQISYRDEEMYPRSRPGTGSDASVPWASSRGSRGGAPRRGRVRHRVRLRRDEQHQPARRH